MSEGNRTERNAKQNMAKYENKHAEMLRREPKSEKEFFVYIMTWEIQIKIYAIQASRWDVKWNCFLTVILFFWGSNSPHDARTIRIDTARLLIISIPTEIIMIRSHTTFTPSSKTVSISFNWTNPSPLLDAPAVVIV